MRGRNDSSSRLPREPFRGTTRERGWKRLSHGLYWPAEHRLELSAELRAWALVLPAEAAFTHLTAAALRGWPSLAEVEHPFFAAVGPRTPVPSRSRVWVSRHPAMPAVEVIDGVRVTSAAETMLAAARDLALLDLVVMGDAALHCGHCTIDDLVAAASERRRGAPMLRSVIPLLDKRSESAWESALRILHVVADIPVVPQRKIYDGSGRFVARADLWIVGTRRIHEYDGAGHREADVHKRDLVREGKLVQADWQRIGYVASQLLNDAGEIIASTDRLLGRTWDARRLRRWQAIVNASLLRPAGQATALAKWWRAPPGTQEGNGATRPS